MPEAEPDGSCLAAAVGFGASVPLSPLPSLAGRGAVSSNLCLGDALSRPLEPACRRRLHCAHRYSTPPARVTQSSTSIEVEDCKVAVLLLLPALRLLRALFRCRLGLRLSLLRHCCPPSHLVMAMSEQCSRESQALHSDYYSAAKKSATPLNEACMRARRH